MKQLLFIFLYIFTADKSAGQCSLIIHQVGVPADTIIVANYEEDHQPKHINDSTYKLIWNTRTPERICLFLDRKTKWWTTIWIEPNIKDKEIIIEYNKKKIILINGSAWDSNSLYWQDLGYTAKADSFAEAFINTNPDDYLSLFFLTHGAYIENEKMRKELLKKLSPKLKNYSEYKQAITSMNERKYPNIGDSFKEFILSDKNDNQYNSSKIKNKWVLLNFWSNTCGPCIKELDAFAYLFNSIDSSKIEFISVSLDEDKSKWKTAKATSKITWTNLWTPDNLYCDLCLNYNLYSMPFFILFDKDKKIFYLKDGANELENIKLTLKEKGLLK